MRSNEFDSAGVGARPRVRRHWLRGVWGNPLARPADRWQAGLRIVLITAWALALPLAATVSSVLVANGLQSIDRSTGTQTQTSAVLLADVPSIMVFSDSVVPPTVDDVQASWTAPDGTARTGPVSALAGLPAGSRVEIWIDRSGARVSRTGATVGGGRRRHLRRRRDLARLGPPARPGVLAQRGTLDRGRRAEWDRGSGLTADPGLTDRESCRPVRRRLPAPLRSRGSARVQ